MLSNILLQEEKISNNNKFSIGSLRTIDVSSQFETRYPITNQVMEKCAFHMEHEANHICLDQTIRIKNQNCPNEIDLKHWNQNMKNKV